MADNLGLIFACYRREFASRIPVGHRWYEDLIGELRLGYCRAAKFWRPAGSAQFKTYAWAAMRNTGQSFIETSFRSGTVGDRIVMKFDELPPGGVNLKLGWRSDGHSATTAARFVACLLGRVTDRRHAAILRLRYVGGHSLKQIGEMVGMQWTKVGTILAGYVKRWRRMAATGILTDPRDADV